MDKLMTAIEYASIMHQDQRRKNTKKTPYINHCIEVARILTSAGITDVDILQAAILHDVIEDTTATELIIRQKFGDKICDLVLECSDDKSLDKVSRKKQQIIHAQQISIEASLIKIADKISNICSLKTDPPTSWSDSIIYGYVVWSKAVHDEISGRNEYLDNTINKIFMEFGIDTVTENDLNNYYLLLLHNYSK